MESMRIGDSSTEPTLTPKVDHVAAHTPIYFF